MHHLIFSLFGWASRTIIFSMSSANKTIQKILIANRGEIACRIIRTAKTMGIKTLALYSNADEGALHTRLADEAVWIGTSPAAQSYLKGDEIIKIAKDNSVDAVHPGYGFLSENAQFARALADQGLIFIGPDAKAIKAMGDKAKAKALMEKAGVPLVPGYHGDDQAANHLKKQADQIGYPVLLKAAAGGGGKGMKPVFASDEFDEALESAKREAEQAFGNADMLIEKLVLNPRHVEIQIFGDRHGNYVHLFERDCSLQRRHQKVIEEAPAPHLPEDVREAMTKAAIDAAKAVDYVGAGTVEFLLDQNHHFYFMEMNTRLQVEHPVSEMITGQDFVEWQIRIAQDEKLPLKQDQIKMSGHAFECRLYAESPEDGFLPQAGTLKHLRPPEDARFDSAYSAIDFDKTHEAQKVSVFYDPMIAKIITHDKNREHALEAMIEALEGLEILGLKTNQAFLKRTLEHKDFKAGKITTAFIEDNLDSLIKTEAQETSLEKSLSALTYLLETLPENYESDPFFTKTRYCVRLDDHDYHVSATNQKHQWRVNDLLFTLDKKKGPQWIIYHEDKKYKIRLLVEPKTIHAFINKKPYHFNWDNPLYVDHKSIKDGGAALISPMPAKITKLFVNPGDTVTQGQTLMVLEAMKMEHSIKAPANGTVHSICAREGDQINEGIELVDFEADQKEAS